MIISARVIKKPRKKRRCNCCDEFINGEQVRLYGCAEIGDKPYVIYEGVPCAKRSSEIKIMTALQAI